MSGYATDREFGDLFLPQVRAMVGPLLLEPAPLDLDTNEATDLVVLKARDLRIGCRVRRPGYAEKYPFDFTIRSARDSGADTELKKIVEGWGDLLFYGHADQTNIIHRWFLVSLDAFRAHLIRDKNTLKKGQTPNGDGTHFAWFDLRSFPPLPPILWGSSHEVISAGAA